jgi:hypothetical protein
MTPRSPSQDKVSSSDPASPDLDREGCAGEGQADDDLRHHLRAKDTAARPSPRNDARRNAIDEALQPLPAIAPTLKTGSDREG